LITFRKVYAIIIAQQKGLIMPNILYSIEKKLPTISKKITSKPLRIKSRLADEISFWQEKKETSSGAYDRLKSIGITQV